MQLKKISIRNKLAIASSTLLLSVPLQGQAEVRASDLSNSNALNENDFSVSGLYYAEENRVLVNKIQNKISTRINDEHLLRVDLIYDTMSGASPNGRIVTNDDSGTSTDIYTTASGGSFDFENSGSGTNNKTWLTAFEDTRKAMNLEWEYKATHMLTTTIGLGTSYEEDYESFSGSGNMVYEFNQRRTSVNVGAALSNDTIKAATGIPEGMATLTCHAEAQNNPEGYRPDWLDCPTGNGTFFQPANKVVTDYIIGFTQVWNRRTIIQANYARGNESGYLTDPYKQISVVKPGFGESAILYEKRPRSRSTNSLYFKSVHVPLDNVALNISYRFFWDDWGVNAHTVDGRLRWNINSRLYIQGHGRLHSQSTASFFTKQVGADVGSESYFSDAPNYLSSDSRLSELASATAGVKLGYKMNERVGMSGRVEHMQQHYYSGVLPRLKVWIVQLILNIKF